MPELRFQLPGPGSGAALAAVPFLKPRAGPRTGRKLGSRLRVKINDATGACVFPFFFPVATALWSPDPSVHFGAESLFSDQIGCPLISVWLSFFIAQACAAQLQLCQPWLWVMSLNLCGNMTHGRGCCAGLSCSVVSNLMDCSPPGSSVHGDFPGKNTGVGYHALLQGIFPTQGLNHGLPALLVDSLPSELSGNPQ